MKIKISAGFSGVIPTGNYANSKPSFAAEYEVEVPDSSDIKKIVEVGQSELHKICYDKFRSVSEQAKIEFIQTQKSSIRFHEYVKENGEIDRYPSVSSVAYFDREFGISEHELNQYASQGTLADIQCRHYLSTGEWIAVDKIKGSEIDLLVLKNGNLKLEPCEFNFPAFIEKYEIKELKEGKLVFSHKHRFAGTPDIRSCIYEGKKYLADWKRTPEKSQFKQLAGYVIAEEENGEPSYDGLMLIGVNPKTKQGFSQPMTTLEIGAWKDAFLKARSDFKKLFMV